MIHHGWSFISISLTHDPEINALPVPERQDELQKPEMIKLCGSESTHELSSQESRQAQLSIYNMIMIWGQTEDRRDTVSGPSGDVIHSHQWSLPHLLHPHSQSSHENDDAALSILNIKKFFFSSFFPLFFSSLSLLELKNE